MIAEIVAPDGGRRSPQDHEMAEAESHNFRLNPNLAPNLVMSEA
jgi:hypothetical protein